MTLSPKEKTRAGSAQSKAQRVRKDVDLRSGSARSFARHALFVMLWGGGYLLLRRVFEGLAGLLTGQPHEVSAVFFAAVISVSAFWACHQILAQRVDRLLFRSRVSTATLLEEMTQKLTSAIHLEQLAKLLAEDIPALLGASWGGLMVLCEAETCLEMLGEEAFDIPLGEVLAYWQEHGSESIPRSLLQSWVTPQTLAMMEARDVEFIVPLQVGDQIVGLWGLGPREGRRSYTSTDLQLVRALAHQSALAVQNARLVRSMESHQAQLEEEVQRHTEAMTADRNRLNAILQNMADALLVTDAHGQIRLTNPAFENLVRHAARNLLGHNVSEVLPLPELAEAVRLAIKAPGVLHATTMTMLDPALNATRDVVLTERILRASVTAIHDGSAVICVLRDITHEVEVDRMKSEFISAVSHELRTPLTSILGFAKLTLRTFERTIAPVLADDMQRASQRVRRNLDIMVMEGERLTNLINDVLDIAALDAGTLEWNDQLCEVPHLVERVVQQYRNAVAEKGLTLTLDMAPSLPLLRADPERLQQVLGNLLSNAIKFTEQGEVTVRSWFVPAGDTFHDYVIPEGGAIALAVIDTGPGIAASEIPLLFQRFSQGGDTLLDKPRGTGLGLAICHEIILHYGGDIWVTSEEGHGATFEFVLPVASMGSAAPVIIQVSPDEPAQSDLETLPFVLMTYNDPTVQDLLNRELAQRQTYRLIVSAFGADVVEQARLQSPAVILLDTAMTQPPGLEVLRALQADPQTASIPVITLSQSEERAQCRAAGAGVCLLKPVDCTTLHHAIVRLLTS